MCSSGGSYAVCSCKPVYALQGGPAYLASSAVWLRNAQYYSAANHRALARMPTKYCTAHGVGSTLFGSILPCHKQLYSVVDMLTVVAQLCYMHLQLRRANLTS